MYLYKKTYVKNWDHMSPKELHKITVKQNGKIRKDIKPERICYITEEVAYWRKANAIHRWFVDNVQDGEDDCGEYYVSHEKLAELVELCKDVVSKAIMLEGEIVNGYTFDKNGKKPIIVKGKNIVNKKEIASILPAQEGFFFGSTDYDEYYLEDMKRTVEILKPLLKEKGDFYYHSSW